MSEELRTMLFSQNIEKVSMKFGECDVTSIRIACRATHAYNHAMGKGAEVTFSSFRCSIIASTRAKDQLIMLMLKRIQNRKSQQRFHVEWR